MRELSPIVLDGPAIARELKLHPVTVRNWAAAGFITRRGKDHRGRTLYDLDEVIAVRDTPKAERKRV